MRKTKKKLIIINIKNTSILSGVSVLQEIEIEIEE